MYMEKNNNLDLLTIILVFMILFLILNGKLGCKLKENFVNTSNKNIEKMTCILNEDDLERLKDKYLWDPDFFNNYSHLDNQFENLSDNDKNKIIDVLTTKSNYSSESQKIGSYFEDPVNVSKLLEKFIEYNSINISNNYDGKIDTNTNLSEVKHILLIFRLFKIFRCKKIDKLGGDSINDISNKLIELLGEEIINICNEELMLQYCSNFNNSIKIGPVTPDILNKELEFFNMGKNLEFGNRKVIEEFENYNLSFKSISMEDTIASFYQEGKYFKDENVESEFFKLFNEYTTFLDNNKKTYDKYSLDDLKKLILYFIPILNEDLDNIDKFDDGTIEKTNALNAFYPKRDLFYHLKFLYKVLGIFKMIQSSKLSQKNKEKALKCCSSDENRCYNFDTEKNIQNPIVFGKNNYGFVKDSKCSPESLSYLKERQNKDLRTFFEGIDSFENLEEYNKNLFDEYLNDLINYFYNIEDEVVDPNNKSLTFFLEKINKSSVNKTVDKLFIPEIKPNTLELDLENIGFSAIIPSNISTLINEIENESDFNEIIKKINSQDEFKDFSNIFDFGSLDTINLVKLSVIKLIEIKMLFIYVNANSKLIDIFMKKILNLEESNLNYYNLLIKVGILPNKQNFLLEKLVQILSDNSYINIKRSNNIKKLMFGDKPKDSISYDLDIFPISSNLNICDFYDPVLIQMRNLRTITQSQFLEYYKEIKDSCENEKFTIPSFKEEKFNNTFSFKSTYESKKMDEIINAVNNFIGNN